MSITNELRKWADDNTVRGEVLTTLPVQHPVHGTVELLLRIADRIDAEHQKAEDEWKAKNGDMWLKGYAACHEELMEGHPVIVADLEKAGWMRLPLDADGEYIHIGDVMEFSRFEIECPVTREVDGVGKGAFFAWCGERGYAQLDADSYSHRHHKQPTVEDVLDDMLQRFSEDGYEGSMSDLIAEYAAKLREILACDAE